MNDKKSLAERLMSLVHSIYIPVFLSYAGIFLYKELINPFLYNVLSKDIAPIVSYIIVFFGLIILAIIHFFIFKKLMKLKNINDAQKQNGNKGIEFISFDDKLIINENRKYIVTRKIKYLALENNVNMIQLRFKWLGKNEDIVIRGSNNCKVEILHQKYTLQHCVKLSFEPVKKGETQEISYSFEIDDKDSKFKDFFGLAVLFPTQEATMCVEFNDFTPKQVKFVKFSTLEAEFPETKSEINLEGNIVKMSFKPSFRKRYVIEWF